MKHFASPDFWFHYRLLPENIQDLADKNFSLLKENSRHPSLRLKKVGIFWSARIGISYRALGKEREEGIVWIWIGTHAEYDQLIK
ncbi:hypothetical protein QEH52_19895 [Coraliomargarita sp. SDUM461003]|uniref:Type II toxin-antitoxin system HigB family toxin n=1 Tax=Thalassobacterium maritimum TaxID=3041265 RepID=A0ABU1B1Y1_9BACT|nr:hypothetical protein [Coraliomargarita sp. SDUM461003]MDQ8209792.1 hypothetical protein [Coraliomargarita sp. SDUM461003]